MAAYHDTSNVGEGLCPCWECRGVKGRDVTCSKRNGKRGEWFECELQPVGWYQAPSWNLLALTSLQVELARTLQHLLSSDASSKIWKEDALQSRRSMCAGRFRGSFLKTQRMKSEDNCVGVQGTTKRDP